MPEKRKRERVYAVLAILGSFIGAAGLICLSVFDTKNYESLHRIFLLIFILGLGISAFFSVIEVRAPSPTPAHDETKRNVPGHVLQYKWLSRDYKDVQKLQFAYVLKAIIVAALFVFSVVFAVTIFTNTDVGGQSSKPKSSVSRRLILFVISQACLNGLSPSDTPCTCSLSGMISVYPRARIKEVSPSRGYVYRPPGVGRVKPTKLSVLRLFLYEDIISPLQAGIDSLFENFNE